MSLTQYSVFHIYLFGFPGSNIFLSERFEPKNGPNGHFHPIFCSRNASKVCLLAQHFACGERFKLLICGVLLVSEGLEGNNFELITWVERRFLDGFRENIFSLE